MISWCDAYHNIDGNVKNLVGNNGKNGFIKMGKKTGNTYVLKNVAKKGSFGTYDGIRCVSFSGCCFEAPSSLSQKGESYVLPQKGCYTVALMCEMRASPCEQRRMKLFTVHDKAAQFGLERVFSTPIGNNLSWGTHTFMGYFKNKKEFSLKVGTESGCVCLMMRCNKATMFLIYDNPNDHQTAQ